MKQQQKHPKDLKDKNITMTETTNSWNEFLPGAWLVENMLTRKECERLVGLARERGIESMDFSGDTRHRQRATCRIEEPGISDLIWERVKHKIPQEIVIGEQTDIPGLLNTPDSQQEFYGRWTPSGVHPRINIAYCSRKGHLAAHRDADSVLNEHERSFLTINGYLTDRPSGAGGATRFLVDEINVKGADILINDSDVLHRVESDKAGKAVVFLHGLMHDGEPLAKGSPSKWVFRSLIYYKRDPKTAPKLSEKQKEARKVLGEAEEAEETGRIKDAIALYSRAYRLDPSLEGVN
jgi:hypothetical protein